MSTTRPREATATPLQRALAARAADVAAATALGAPGRGWLDAAALSAHIDLIASGLVERGLRPGDAVAVVVPNGPEMALAFLGTSAAATCAPLNPALTRQELTFYLDDLDARAVIVSAGARHHVEQIAKEHDIAVLTLSLGDELSGAALSLDGPAATAAAASPRFAADVALVLHTSGTTARPKIVPLRHDNLYASAQNIAVALDLSPDDRCGNIMPLFHIHGLMAGLAAPLVAGGSVLCTPGCYAPEVLGWFDAAGVTWTTAVPTMHQTLLDRARAHPDELPRVPLRFLRSSSASLAPATMAALEECFRAPVIEAYGMTEAAHQICSNPLPPARRLPGSVGRAAGPDVAVVDAHGVELPAGETGEVVIRGANVTPGYVTDDPEINARARFGEWLRTGDQGHLDEAGFLVLTGRLKELINRGGEKIAPREVDEVLLDHPAVAQALTFAVPDARLGEQVAAAVVPVAGSTTTERELRAFAATRLAPFKVPRRIALLETIPTGPTGKPQRIGLADRLGLHDLDAVAGAQPYTAPRDPVEELVASWWCDVLGVGEVGVLDHFLDVGGDSLLAAKLLARVRRELDVELAMLDFFDAPTVAAQAQLIATDLLADDR